MPALSLPRFSRAEIVFSTKSFAAAMLAMYLASRAGLPRPFWALMTTYVVAHPLAGAVRSKAVYRFCGTLIGSTATVLLVPALSNAPELLTLVLALWVGLCLCISLFDRTPRSYVFMLAGYTAALIGFPSVQAPEALFDTAVARVEEIGLGIFCATLLHSLVLPAGMGPTVLGLLDRTLQDARKWLGDLLQPPASATGTPARRADADPRRLADDRRRLAGDITQLRILSTHVPFDTTHLRWTAGAIRAMQDRVAALTPALSAVEDRLLALEQAEGAIAPDVAALLAQTGQWLREEGAGTSDDARLQALRATLAALAATRPGASISPWGRALRIALAGRLEELVEGWRACARLRADIDDGLKGAVPPRRVAALGNRVLHLDRGMALLSALAAVLAICLCGAFWILTGWSMGSAATMMAAVFCCFFATMDDPVPAIQGFLQVDAVVDPDLRALRAGAAAAGARLRHAGRGLRAGVPGTGPVHGPAGLLHGRDGAAVRRRGHAGDARHRHRRHRELHQQHAGPGLRRGGRGLRHTAGALGGRRLERAPHPARHLARARRDGRRAAAATPVSLSPSAQRRGVPGDAYAVRMLDRIGLLAPRIAQAGGRIEGVAADDALRDLRMGADIDALQRVRAQLPLASASALLGDIARFFRQRAGGRVAARPASLLARIDEALASMLGTAGASSADARSAVTALVGLRRNLFPEAPPMRAASAVPVPVAAQGVSR